MKLTKEMLEQLYIDEQFSAETIAEMAGVSQSTILNWLRDYDIPRRIGGPPKGWRPSDEVRARQSEQRRGAGNARYGAKLSDETRQKIAEKARGRKASEETRALMRENNRGERNPFFGQQHTDDTKARVGKHSKERPRTEAEIEHLRAANKGKVISEEQRRKISAALRGKPRFSIRGMLNHNWGKEPPHGKVVWYERADGITIRMRSTWESRIAAALDTLGLDWEYEPRRFVLEDRTYTPDFYLPQLGIFYEVKGWFHERHQETVRQFRALYPDVALIVVTEPILKALEHLAKTQGRIV